MKMKSYLANYPSNPSVFKRLLRNNFCCLFVLLIKEYLPAEEGHYKSSSESGIELQNFKTLQYIGPPPFTIHFIF